MSGPGELLRRHRLERGLSLAQLADKAKYSKGYLSNIENGARPLPERMARELDRVLETDGVLIRARTPRPPAPEPQPDTADEPWSLLFDPAGHIQLGEGLLVTTRVAPNSFVLDDRTLAMFETHFEQLRALGHGASPAFVIPHLITDLNTLRTMLRADAAPELVRLAYKFAEYTGWMFQEAGKIDRAHALTQYAVQLARRVGDAALGGYALVRAAEIALYDEDGYSMVDLARRADTTPGVTAAVRSLAAQREAQGHALLGDLSACLSALDSAAHWQEIAEGEAGPRYGTTSLPDPIAITRGWSMFHLDPEDSAGLLPTAIDLIPPASIRSRVRFGVRLARVTVECQDIEGACLQVADLLDDLRRADSATVRVDLKHLRDRLARHATNPTVRDLRPELNDLLRVRQVGP